MAWEHRLAAGPEPGYVATPLFLLAAQAGRRMGQGVLQILLQAVGAVAGRGSAGWLGC